MATIEINALRVVDACDRRIAQTKEWLKDQRAKFISDGVARIRHRGMLWWRKEYRWTEEQAAAKYEEYATPEWLYGGALQIDKHVSDSMVRRAQKIKTMALNTSRNVTLDDGEVDFLFGE
jgi:hypothetical protein